MTFTAGQVVAFIIGLLGAILTVLNIIDKSASLKALKETPFKTLAGKVEQHEDRIGKIESSLFLDNDRFREQDETNEVMQICMLALIDFELSYCSHTNYEYTEDLIKAKDALRKHLASK